MVEVIWSKRANKERIATLVYGVKHFGIKATEKLNERIENYAILLAENPRMGIVEPLLAQRRHEYRSFVVHEHYKLVYYIIEDTLYIVDLWDTRRKPKGLAHRIQT